MSTKLSPGAKFRQALANNKPLQVVGTINAYCAMMAEQLGHQAIYLSGGGVANASYGLPDLGMTSLNDVIADVQRITSACSLAAVDARTDDDFFIMARTDAFAQEGLEAAIARAKAYVAAGADGIFAEAVQTEEHYRAFSAALDVPILANITEFGQTELWNKEQLGEWGAAMVLYPLSAFRAMNKSKFTNKLYT